MKSKYMTLSMALCTVAAFGMTGCKSSTQIGGEGVIQIKAYKGGFGTEWLHAAAEAFTKAFPKITFEFVDESSGVTESAAQEIFVPKNNQIDLYFTNGTDMYDCIERSATVLRTKNQTLLEPLTEVFNSKAVNAQGQEESETIASRFYSGYKENCEYHGDLVKWDGQMYKLPWADASTGLFCNPSVLNKYGLSIPLTTNELKATVEAIASHTETDNVYPFSWAGQNASGYWSYLYETWFAQYSGKTAFDNFMKCNPSSGNIKTDGWKVYEDKGILEGLKAMFDILDLKYSPNGSASKAHMEAQNEFVQGKSAFMVDGDWLLHEMSADYFDQVKNIEFVRAPILSSIGTEIGITDEQLHTLVEMIDESKTNQEIKVAIATLTDENIERVRTARSVHCGIGIGHDMFIPSYSDAKDAAKLFMRFLYSNDGCRIFRKYARANMPLKFEIDPAEETTNFQKSVDKLSQCENPIMISGSAKLNKIRSAAQIFIFNYSAWVHPTTYKAIMIDKNGEKKLSPTYMFEKETTYMKDNWAKYMSYIG